MEKLLLIYLAILLSACAGMSEQATLPILVPAANQADCDYEFKDVEDEDNSTIAMIDGKPVDGMVCYTSKGRLESKQIYKDGWEEGAIEWYYENSACNKDNLDSCKIEAIAHNKQGLLNGRINKYYESGKLAIEATFLDGKRQGLQTDYYENGKLHSEVFFKADKQHGTATFYHESGGIDSIEQWVEGKAEGLAKSYYESGKQEFGYTSQISLNFPYTFVDQELKSEADGAPWGIGIGYNTFLSSFPYIGWGIDANIATACSKTEVNKAAVAVDIMLVIISALLGSDDAPSTGQDWTECVGNDLSIGDIGVHGALRYPIHEDWEVYMAGGFSFTDLSIWHDEEDYFKEHFLNTTIEVGFSYKAIVGLKYKHYIPFTSTTDRQMLNGKDINLSRGSIEFSLMYSYD